MTGAAHNVDAVVVALHPSGDTTWVAQLLTPTLGKLGCVARGARTPNKRFTGGLDVLTRIHASVLAPLRGDLHTLVTAEVTDAFLPLRGDPMLLARAAYAAELGQALSAVGHATPGIFETLTLAMRALCGAPAGPALLRWVETQYLLGAGHLAPLHRCLGCDAAWLGQAVFMDVRQPGHLFCGRCAVPGCTLLDAPLVTLLEGCCTWSVEQAALANPPRPTSQAVGKMLAAVMDPLLSRPLKSKAYLVGMQRLAG